MLNQISETALGEAEKDSFIALPSKRRHTDFCLERLCVPTQEDFFFFFWPCNPACVVPGPGLKFTPPAFEAQSFNHWMAREVPNLGGCDEGDIPMVQR